MQVVHFRASLAAIASVAIVAAALAGAVPALANSAAPESTSGAGSSQSAITPYLTPVGSWQEEGLGADHDDRWLPDADGSESARFADRARVGDSEPLAALPGRRRPGTVLLAEDGPEAAGTEPVRFTFGLPLASAPITSRFGLRWHPLLGGMRVHAGVDLAAPAGAPVVASADGTVSSAGWAGGYGLLVALEHGGGRQTRYAHLSRLNVSAGQTVRKGQVIGFVGSTGRSTGPHLHYETRINGTAVDPLRR